MAIGDFRSPNLHYKGWLETVRESNQIEIADPSAGKTFFTDLGKSKKEITVGGLLRGGKKGKALVIIRTDRDYPQAIDRPRSAGKWSFPACTLGGVDHQIYAVLVDENDAPIFRSKIVNVRLERKT